MKALLELLNQKMLLIDKDYLCTNGSFFITKNDAIKCLECLKNYLEKCPEENCFSSLEGLAVAILVDMLGANDEALEL